MFTSADAVNLLRAPIARAANENAFSVIAYYVMPDHVHLLVIGDSEASDCRTFIARAKQYSGFHFAQVFEQKLWQRYGWERTLRDDEKTMDLIRYIVGNPVRAGLTKRAADYPFMGSLMYSLPDLLALVGEPISRSGDESPGASGFSRTS